MDEIRSKLENGEYCMTVDHVYNILSDELSRGRDGRQVAEVAFDVYCTSETPDGIRLLEMAISCMAIIIGKYVEEYNGPLDLILYSVILHERYLVLGRTQDLEDCLKCTSAACAKAKITPADYPDLAGWLGMLGVMLSNQYTKTGNSDDFDTAIAALEEAVDAKANSHSDENPAEQLSALGVCWRKRFVQTKNLGDLTAAIIWFEASVKATPMDDHPRRQQRLGDYGSALLKRYTKTYNIYDLDAAIYGFQEAVAAVVQHSPGDTDRITWLKAELGMCWGNRYVQTKSLRDLETAINLLEASVKDTREGNPCWGDRLSNYGAMLAKLYTQTQNIHHFDAAIGVLQDSEAIDSTSVCEVRAQRLDALGMCWETRYRYDDHANLGDLTTAITWFKMALEATIGEHDKKRRLRNLGAILGMRYTQTKDPEDLDQAIGLLETWFDPEDGTAALNLAVCLNKRYERTEKLEDLELAISHAETALEHWRLRYIQPGSSPIIEQGPFLNYFARMLANRYEHSGNMCHLNDAIAQLEVLVEAVSKNPSVDDQGAYLSNLTAMLAYRFESTGDPHDFETALARLGVILETAPITFKDRSTVLTSLGGLFYQRYLHSQDLVDLDAAIVQCKKALAVGPEEGKLESIMVTSRNLGLMLGNRYQNTGDIRDLEEAITRCETVLKTTTSSDHQYENRSRAKCLLALGLLLIYRYEHTGNLKDLDASIARLETAACIVPRDHISYGTVLHFLANCLGIRSKRTGNLTDLDVAISHEEKALEATPENHSRRVRYLSTLGDLFISRFIRGRSQQDINSAVSVSQTALQTAPQNDPFRKEYLNTLAIALNNRSFGNGEMPDPQDLAESISCQQACIEITPAGHPCLVHAYYTLGMFLLQYRALCDNDTHVSTTQQALDAFIACWATKNAPISYRLQGALMASQLLTFVRCIQDLPRAYSLLQDAIQLLPVAASRSLEREDQQYILAKSGSGLASLAASVCLETGQPPSEALRLLELGRSVTNSQLLDYRSDISELVQEHPDLGEEFERLRRELDRPLPGSSSFTEELSGLIISSSQMVIEKRVAEQQIQVNRRNKVAEDLNIILQTIREKQGFENFLRADSIEYMLAAASEGPIVVLNVTKLRSDALLVTRDKVTSLALPLLSHTSLATYLTEDAAMIYDQGPKRKLLQWLWNAAVEPVLTKLGFYPKVRDPLPRIWWIGVGLMAKAPLHAAAKYRRGALKLSMLDYSIPSYTPTIRVLTYSRSKCMDTQGRRPLKSPRPNLLVVNMPMTPSGYGPLDVDTEVKHIQNTMAEGFEIQVLTRPTAETVLEILPNCSIVHFACHGISNPNPAESHLLLLKESIHPDGRCEEGIDPLRVKDIASRNCSGARLAFLSACNTADNMSKQLADEVTHIASSFQVAGFSQVIATLWPTDDQACNTAAATFYSSLSSTDDIAVSYRKAVLAVMKERPMAPDYWAPFVHFGA